MTARRGRWLPAARLITLVAASSLLLAATPGPSLAVEEPGPGDHGANACGLRSQDGRIEHVVNVVFDNTHFTRDDPNVPSDLEQMPHLLDFIEGGGTLISHEHTPLISHTGTNILTSITGLYGDLMGQPVSNAFGFYDTNSAATFRSSFAYWTARLGGHSDDTFFMTTAGGK